MGTILGSQATIRARVKWQQVGDKCSAEFFKSVRQKNSQAVLSELRDKHGRSFNKMIDLNSICFNFYKNLYGLKKVSEEAIMEVFIGFRALFTEEMNASLTREITERELGGVVRDMAKGKAPGHDGIPIEFFQRLWPTVGKYFLQMILSSTEKGELHVGVTKGIICLIPKEGNPKDLNHWRPITLLPVIYKIFAKTLQLRLQPMLRDVISPEQTAFLLLRFILDNIVLAQETLHWAKTSRQPTVFLKLDFSKAYDKVSWRFLFHVMHMMGIDARFIQWVKLLFGNASAAVNINGSPGSTFKVERGVWQGCPLAPYLFLIVGEALTHTIKKSVEEKRLKGVVLPGGKKQQCISQYADDSSFMVRGEKRDIDELVRLLKTFSEASGMEINWDKSCPYWFDKYTHRPEWLAGYNWKWAEEGDLSKLLGTPFGLNLNTPDVDKFLYNKISKKLDYWSTIKLSLGGRIVICNQVLLSTLWFFITVWGGSNKILTKIRGAIRNYLRSGKEQLTRTRVSWRECCLKKK